MLTECQVLPLQAPLYILVSAIVGICSLNIVPLLMFIIAVSEYLHFQPHPKDMHLHTVHVSKNNAIYCSFQLKWTFEVVKHQQFLFPFHRNYDYRPDYRLTETYFCTVLYTILVRPQNTLSLIWKLIEFGFVNTI